MPTPNLRYVGKHPYSSVKWGTHGVLTADMGPTHGIDEETTLNLTLKVHWNDLIRK